MTSQEKKWQTYGISATLTEEVITVSAIVVAGWFIGLIIASFN